MFTAIQFITDVVLSTIRIMITLPHNRNAKLRSLALKFVVLASTVAPRIMFIGPISTVRVGIAHPALRNAPVTVAPEATQCLKRQRLPRVIYLKLPSFEHLKCSQGPPGS